MSLEINRTAGEVASWLMVTVAGCLLSVPTLALAGFGLLAIAN